MMGKDVGFRKRYTALLTLVSDYAPSSQPLRLPGQIGASRPFLPPMTPFSSFLLYILLKERWPPTQHAHPATKGLPESREGVKLPNTTRWNLLPDKFQRCVKVFACEGAWGLLSYSM